MRALPRRAPGGGRGGGGGDAPRGARAAAHADPRRHGRLRAQRARAADAEPLHRRPRVPLRARVGVGAGDGVRRGGRRAARRRLGRARPEGGMARRWAPGGRGDGKFTVLRDPERPSGRLLRQGGMDASYVDLADPSHLGVRLPALAARRGRGGGRAARRARRRGGVRAGPGARRGAARATSRRWSSSTPSRLEIARRHLGLRRAPGPEGARRRRAVPSCADARTARSTPSSWTRSSAPACRARLVTARGARRVRACGRRSWPSTSSTPSRSTRRRRSPPDWPAAFPHVLAAGPAAVAARRRGGNVDASSARARRCRQERLRARLAAADRSPAVAMPLATGGALPFRDG